MHDPMVAQQNLTAELWLGEQRELLARMKELTAYKVTERRAEACSMMLV